MSEVARVGMLKPKRRAMPHARGKASRPSWERLLVCEVVSISYDFRRRSGRLFMPPGNCCDMKGCLELFRTIDSGVVEILTFAGDRADTIYRKVDHEWIALLPVATRTP